MSPGIAVLVSEVLLEHAPLPCCLLIIRKCHSIRHDSNARFAAVGSRIAAELKPAFKMLLLIVSVVVMLLIHRARTVNDEQDTYEGSADNQNGITKFLSLFPPPPLGSIHVTVS